MKTPQLPFPKLSEALGIATEVWFKREDLHHYGSHKGRSIPLMINEYRKQGVTNFVVSSSGNAALAAAQAIDTYNKNKKGKPLTLKILVGKKITPEKLANLEGARNKEKKEIIIEQCERPKQMAFQIEKEGKATWLRQSTSDVAVLGYRELADELNKIENLAAVFVPTSSGTTAQGLFDGFQGLQTNPQIHIVQTDICHPMVESPLLPTPYSLQPSLATAIVDNIALRKEKVLEAIKNSHGAGWIATNEKIKEAMKLVKEKTDIIISPNSALSVVGLMQAIQAGWKWGGAVVCLITGR